MSPTLALKWLSDYGTPPVPPSQFCWMLRAGLHLLSMSEQDAAEQFGVTKVTIRRWGGGDTVPLATKQAEVRAFLLTGVREKF